MMKRLPVHMDKEVVFCIIMEKNLIILIYTHIYAAVRKVKLLFPAADFS